MMSFFPQKPGVSTAVNEENAELHADGEENVFYYAPESNQYRPTKFTGPIHKLLEKIPDHLQIVRVRLE